jgi:hypothetical protein
MQARDKSTVLHLLRRKTVMLASAD